MQTGHGTHIERKICLYCPNASGRPQTSEERDSRMSSPKTLMKHQEIHKNNFGYAEPPTRVWRNLIWYLLMKLCKLQLVLVIATDYKRKHKQFSVDMQEKLEEAKFNERLVFSDEGIFHTNGKVSKHNVHIQNEGNPHATDERERKSPKVNASRAITRSIFITHFSLWEIWLVMFICKFFRTS